MIGAAVILLLFWSPVSGGVVAIVEFLVKFVLSYANAVHASADRVFEERVYV